jgi:hypothetical protein
MLRILYIYAALALTSISVCGQPREAQEPQAANPQNPRQAAQPSSSGQSPPSSQSQQHRPPSKRIPAAQYSPLAAQADTTGIANRRGKPSCTS